MLKVVTHRWAVGFLMGALCSFSSLWAADTVVTNQGTQAENLPEEMQQIRITERLGDHVTVDQLTFTDEGGNKVKLSEYFSAKKPVIFLMVYYKCPGICNHLLNGFTESVRTLDYTVGKEFEIVTVSINPKEGPELAAGKKETYARKYGRDGAQAGWHWLVGEEAQVKSLADQLGFGYRLDEKSGEYAHSAAIFVLTPDARISRVLYGIDYPNRDLKMSLLEASNGKVGTITDRILMFCFKYDPMSRGYALYGLRLVQAGGILTMLILGGYLYWFWSRGRSRSRGALRS